MTPAEVQAKAHELMAPIVGVAPASDIVDNVMNLEKVADITTLRPLLQAS